MVYKKKKGMAKRPNVASIRLTNEARAIFKAKKRNNWSHEISCWIIGHYMKHSTPEQKLLYARELLRGYQMAYEKELQKVRGEYEHLMRELDHEITELEELVEERKQVWVAKDGR